MTHSSVRRLSTSSFTEPAASRSALVERKSASSSSSHETFLAHRSVTEANERFAANASLPRSEFAVALLPLPVWPTSTKVRRWGGIAHPRPCARDCRGVMLPATADEEKKPNRGGVGREGTSRDSAATDS